MRITWTINRGSNPRTSETVGIGDLLADAGYGCLEYSDEWGSMFAWNATIAALLGCAAKQAADEITEQVLVWR